MRVREYTCTKLTDKEIVGMRLKYGAKHYSTVPDFVPDHAKGVWIWDVNGKKYLDLNATYSAIAVGHCNPELIAAMTEQAHRLTSVQNKFPTAPQSRLLKCVSELTGMDQTILMNSGAEAVDTATKGCKRWGYEVKGIPENAAEIIVANDCFHGRTHNATAMSSNPKYRRNFGPFAPGYIHVPFGDFDAFNNAVSRTTAAFIVEPIQGEGGIRLPPPDYLQKIRAYCTIYRILLIFDEIQTGFGRTGTLFASEHYGVKPDAMLLGKALGEIYPVSAMAGRKELMDVFDPGSHGSTFGGNPLGCAIALKSLEMILRYDRALIRNSADIGAYFLKQLTDAGLNARGKGLFIGVQLDPAKKSAEAACHELLLCEPGIIAGAAGHDDVVRLTPPLIFTKADVDLALPHLVKILA